MYCTYCARGGSGILCCLSEHFLIYPTFIGSKDIVDDPTRAVELLNGKRELLAMGCAQKNLLN